MPQEESNSNSNVLDESRPLLTDHSGDIVSMESRDGPSKPINLIKLLILSHPKDIKMVKMVTVETYS